MDLQTSHVAPCPDNAGADLSAGSEHRVRQLGSRTAETGEANRLERPVKIFGVLVPARPAR